MTSLTQAHCCTPSKPQAQRSIWAQMMQAVGLARQRRTLAALDPHMLRDIGITPDEAQAEAAKPLWDVPRHWRQ
jgi:uncharacterized protein YjiS (DUF1127 family)